MKTIRHDKPGYFPTPPGTCLIKPDLPLPDGTKPLGKNWHPYIVIDEDEETVKCLMGRTLTDAKTGKDRTWKLGKIPGAVEINDPCPPMDFKDRRRQYVDTSQVIIIPKAILYASCDVEICSFRGRQLSKEQTKQLACCAKEQSARRGAYCADPYDCAHRSYPTDAYPRNSRPLPRGCGEHARTAKEFELQ